MPVVYKSEPTVLETLLCTQYRSAQTDCSKTSPTVYDEQTLATKWRVHNMEGRTVPGWRKMRNEGAILPMTFFKQFEYGSNMSLGSYDVCQQNGHRYWFDQWYVSTGANFWGYKPSGPPSGTIVDDQELSYFVQAAAAAIASSGWDALTFLAEFKQLRRMFSGITTKLDNLSRGLSPGRVHDLWLEGRYGWRVLTYDIRDLHEVLTKYNDKRTRFNQKRGYTRSFVLENYAEPFDGNATYYYSESISCTVNMRGTVVADVDVPKIQFNPVVTAWEVTRLSFVIDWLLNVGQSLDAAYFLLITKGYQAAGGYRVDINSEMTVGLVAPEPNCIVHSINGGWSGSGYYEYRTPMSVSAIPRLKLRLDKWKALDLLSLIAQRIL